MKTFNEFINEEHRFLRSIGKNDVVKDTHLIDMLLDEYDMPIDVIDDVNPPYFTEAFEEMKDLANIMSEIERKNQFVVVYLPYITIPQVGVYKNRNAAIASMGDLHNKDRDTEMQSDDNMIVIKVIE